MNFIFVLTFILGVSGFGDNFEQFDSDEAVVGRIGRARRFTDNKETSCPSGWYFDVVHSRCYKIIHNVAFDDAQLECANNQAKLVTIASESKNTVIRELTKSGAANELYHGNTLLGARKEGDNFVWQDGSDMTYTRWAKNEPNNNGDDEDCVSMYTDPTIGYEEDVDQSYQSRWNDIPCCSVQRVAVCEKTPESSVLVIQGFRVVSFNTWGMGEHVENGLQKLATHLLTLDADIVSLQEVQDEARANALVAFMPGWSIICAKQSYPDIAILTKHKIISETITHTIASLHATILLPDGSKINFWSFHGCWRAYGPYAALDQSKTELDQIILGEHAPSRNQPGRLGNTKEIVNGEMMKRDLQELLEIPTIIAGDFNTASHLDWIEENKDIHGGWVVPWPCTKLLADQGFIDSFRDLYPDPVKYPGLTWSTVCKRNGQCEEPQDRIDFVFYQGRIRPIRSELYSGTEPIRTMPDQWTNDYPSDHFAVFTDFEFIE